MPLPDLTPDPITVVYRQIRTGLLAHKGFTDIIPALNFPDMSNTSFVKFAEDIQPGRLPEQVLVQSAFRMSPYGSNSMVSEVVQSFDLIATMRNLQVLQLNGVKWHTFVALFQLGIDLGLGSLVRDWNVEPGTDDAFGQPEWKRGTERYVSMARITTKLCFPRSFVGAAFQPQP